MIQSIPTALRGRLWAYFFKEQSWNIDKKTVLGGYRTSPFSPDPHAHSYCNWLRPMGGYYRSSPFLVLALCCRPPWSYWNTYQPLDFLPRNKSLVIHISKGLTPYAINGRMLSFLAIIGASIYSLSLNFGICTEWTRLACNKIRYIVSPSKASRLGYHMQLRRLDISDSSESISLCFVDSLLAWPTHVRNDEPQHAYFAQLHCQESSWVTYLDYPPPILYSPH